MCVGGVQTVRGALRRGAGRKKKKKKKKKGEGFIVWKAWGVFAFIRGV